MADNSLRTPGVGETIRTEDKAGAKTQVVIIDSGGSGAEDIAAGIIIRDGGNVITVDGTVAVSSVGGTVTVSGTVDTELPAAAALTDNFANPTAPGVGAFGMLWDGATWDRRPGNSTDGTLVNLGANNDVTVTSGAVTADTELPAAAALSADNVASPTAPAVGAFAHYFDGTNWDRARGDSTDGALVNLGANNDVVVTGNITTVTTVSTVSAVSAITPGTGATNLGKAEDAIHATGDVGVMALAVRADTAAATGANGDYLPLLVDANGRLHTADAAELVDDAAFTPGTSLGIALFGFADETSTDTVNEGDIGAVRMTVDRQLRVAAASAPTATLANVGDSATSVTVLAANVARKGAIIVNDSAAILYLKFGATASTSSFTYKLDTMETLEIPGGAVVYTGIIDGIWASDAGGNARVTELT